MIARQAQPFASPPWLTVWQPDPAALAYEQLVARTMNDDVLSHLCQLCGLRAFPVLACVCSAWHRAVRAKMRDWGVLMYANTIRGGYGKRRGELDTPTWICMLADGKVCVCDSCNNRLQVFAPRSGPTQGSKGPVWTPAWWVRPTDEAPPGRTLA